jgi:hypothetical protein
VTKFSTVSEVLDALAPAVEVETEAWDDVLARAELLDAAAADDSRLGVAVRALRRRWQKRASARRPRVPVLVALLILALVSVAAAAYALGYRFIDFSSAPPAAPRVVTEFSSLSLDAPPGMDPRVIAGETRLVGTIEGHKLWVAPTKAGGLCYLWSRGGGGCEALGTLPLDIGWSARGRGSPSSKPLELRFQAVEGFARAGWVDAVEIRLDDGSTIRPQLIWISPPIDAGFYYYDAPEGRAVEAVLGLKKGEVVIAEQAPLPRPLPQPHPYADLSKRQQLAEVETSEGLAALWSAPTKAGLRCTWLEFRGEEVAALSSSCIPRGYENRAGLSYAVYALGEDRILAGMCGYRATAFIHRDGSIRTVDCTDGVVLAKLTRADAAGWIAAVDENGRLLERSRSPMPPPTHSPGIPRVPAQG